MYNLLKLKIANYQAAVATESFLRLRSDARCRTRRLTTARSTAEASKGDGHRWKDLNEIVF